MANKILDIYSDYLICQNKYATATGLSDLLSGDISHDKITKYLNSEDLGSKELWVYVKPQIGPVLRTRAFGTLGIMLGKGQIFYVTFDPFLT